MLSSRPPRPVASGFRRRRTFTLEGLERRIVLSPAPTIYTVTTTIDDTSGPEDSGDSGSLRYVLGLANADPNPDGSTIVFDSTFSGATINLSPSLGTLGFGSLGFGRTTGPKVIQGPTAGVTINGGNAFEVFRVSTGVTATISGLTIAGGSTSRDGGGILSYGTLTLVDCTVSRNSARYLGGGISSQGSLTLTNCTISDNSAGSEGGGIRNSGALSLTGCTVSDNSAKGGGGIFHYGALTLTGCTISGNSSYDAGGISNVGNTLTLVDCTVSGNFAAHRAGGILNVSTMTVIDCTVSGNSAKEGGGIFNYRNGTATVIGSTLANNYAVHFGGGILNLTNGTLTVTNCTLSGNSVANTGSGGIYNAIQATVTLTNTIVAGNTLGGRSNDIAGPGAGAVTGTYDLIGPGGSGGISSGSGGNIVLGSLTALGLGTLGNYGGTTETIPLLPGSVALAAGTQAKDANGNPITTDQRGDPIASPPDIGAFQSQGFTFTTVARSTPQATPVGTRFSNPLAVTVTANNPNEPVAGGIVNFTVPSSGASAGLTDATATIGSDGQVGVTATANATPGRYNVILSAAGLASPILFTLINQIQPAFVGLSDQTITYGTASVTLTGRLKASTPVPDTETIAVTLDRVTNHPTLGPDGAFATTFDTANLHASTTAYTVRYGYTSDEFFSNAGAASQLTVLKAPLTITAASETMPFGGPVPALTATYTGFVNVQTSADLATPVELSTTATSNSPAGTYAITVTGASSADYTINEVDGTLAIAPPVLPAGRRARAGYGFVTSLYQDVLGREPEPKGFHDWTRRWSQGTPSPTIFRWFARSRERRILDHEGRAPTIRLRSAYAHAMRASRQAARLPAGPLSLHRNEADSHRMSRPGVRRS